MDGLLQEICSGDAYSEKWMANLFVVLIVRYREIIRKLLPFSDSQTWILHFRFISLSYFYLNGVVYSAGIGRILTSVQSLPLALINDLKRLRWVPAWLKVNDHGSMAIDCHEEIFRRKSVKLAARTQKWAQDVWPVERVWLGYVKGQIHVLMCSHLIRIGNPGWVICKLSERFVTSK